MGDLNHLSSVVLNAHENMHGLVYLNQLNERYNFGYNELLTRFIEKVCISNLKEQGYGNIEKEFNAFLNYYNRGYAEHYIDSINLLESNCNDPVIRGILKYNSDMSYVYLIGMIYGSRLYECYINNPKEVISKVDSVIQGNHSIADLLDNFDINLRNDDTIKAFQKTLK